MKVREYIWLFLIAILVMLFAYEYFVQKPFVSTVLERDTVLLRDTILLTTPGKIKYRVKTRVDTVVNTKYIYTQDTLGFRSCVDTAIGKASVNVCYEYPLNAFAIQVAFRPDTVRLVTVVEKPLFRYEQTKTSLWWDVAKVGGGVVVGYILGKAR